MHETADDYQPDDYPSPFDDARGGDDDAGTSSGSSKVLKILAGIVIFASFLPWAWRFSPFADRTPDGLLDDPTYATIAEPICAGAMAELEALPNALDATTTAERGEQVRDANNILTVMVDELEAARTGSDADLDRIDSWIENWRTYLENRADYAERISVDENAVLYVAASGQERIDKRIPRFADANEIRSCHTPDDIA